MPSTQRTIRRRRLTRAVTVVVAVMAVTVAVLAGLGVFTPGSAPSVQGLRLGRSPSPPARPPPAVLAGLTAEAPTPTAAGLSRALTGTLKPAVVGTSVGYEVLDEKSGRVLASRSATKTFTPASVTKLVTGAAVLAAQGPRARLSTRVVAGSTPGQIVLVGGGDPTLSKNGTQQYPGAGRIDRLADSVRAALKRPVTSVVVDGSLYGGSRSAPGWDPGLVAGGNVAPISSVMVDGGRLKPHLRARSAAPELLAGKDLATALGVPAARVTRGKAPSGARRLATVQSAPMAVLIEQTLRDSDNVLAEALARQVAITRHQPVTFAGAAKAVRAEIASLGIPTAGLALSDGSGLSRRNKISPATLTGVLRTAGSDARPGLRSLLTALPVADYSGTLADRFAKGPSHAAAGKVRAKTGSLSGINAVAGLVVDADGRLLVVALMANDSTDFDPRPAEAGLDVFLARLAGCGCR